MHSFNRITCKYLVADLVGVRGYNVLELWNFISHSLERMIIEVRAHYF